MGVPIRIYRIMEVKIHRCSNKDYWVGTADEEIAELLPHGTIIAKTVGNTYCQFTAEDNSLMYRHVNIDVIPSTKIRVTSISASPSAIVMAENAWEKRKPLGSETTVCNNVKS